MSTLHPPAPTPLFLHSGQPQPITVDEAEAQLSAFLHLTSIDPSLRPDSVLSSRGDGPQSNSGGMSGSSNVNLTLWHLERVLKGLRGENLGWSTGAAKDALRKLGDESGGGDGVVEVEGWGDDGDSKKNKRRKVQQQQVWEERKVKGVPKLMVGGDDDNNDGGAEERARGDGTTADEWQDREDFELEQEVVEGEVGERDAAVPETEVPEEVQIGEPDGEEEGGVRSMLDEAAAEAAEEIGRSSKKAKTDREKADRKNKKKERRKEEKRAKEKAHKG